MLTSPPNPPLLQTTTPAIKLARRLMRLALAVAVSATPPAWGQCIESEQQKLTASDPEPDSEFGYSLSVDGDTAVVGSWADNCAAGPNCGSAYVFRYNGSTWVEEQKLVASDAIAALNFGGSVAVSGDTAVLSARGDDCADGSPGSCGSAYVFRYDGSTWVEEQKLTALDAVAGESFGGPVRLSGDVAVVGAHTDDCDSGSSCGSAYIFRYDGSTWVQEQKLVASDVADHNHFGISASVSGDVVVVGAPGNTCAAGLDCGAAYIYRYDGALWVEEQKLVASDPAMGANFGTVSVSDDVALVGAYFDNCPDGLPGSCGSAYVFRYNGSLWVEEQKLHASDATGFDFFGRSVSIRGDVAVVGAHYDDPGGCLDCGSAYVYRYVGSMWVEEKKLIASDPTNSKHLGHHAAVGDDVVLVGTNPTGEQDDSAYVYTLPPPPCHTFAECADADGDAIRDDNCVWWSCDCGVCSGTDLVFADMGGAFGDCLPDHTVDGNDRFHALNCFSNQGVTPGSPYPCEPGPPASTNVDAGGPFRACCPDGVCDANDAMQALHTFSDENPCTCPANFACPCPIPTAGICLGNGQSCTSDDDCGGGDCHLVMCPLGPQPEAPSGSPIDWPRVVDRSAVRLVGDRSEAAPGDLIDVDVYLKDAVADLQGYQLHVEAAGGKRGALELVDVAIDERREHVFAGLAGWRAFNVHTRQMLAGLDSPGVATRPGAYLATFTFQASPDAAGTFSVELLHDNRDPAQRTFIFPTPPGAKIEVESAAAAVVIIREKPALSRLSRTSWKAPAR